MIALIDLDSLIYKAKHKIEQSMFILSLGQYASKEKVDQEIIDQSLHRLEKMYQHILEEIESAGIFFDSMEFYVTTCEKSIRKRIYPEYKKDRVFDELRYKITRRFVEETDLAFCDEEYEADDLIADRIKELDQSDYVILSLDKDVLKQVGLHYNYYRKPSEQNEPVNPMKGIGYTDNQEHKRFLAYQMLVGDSSDGINGVKGIGDKKANKILEGKITDYQLFRSVISTYLNKGYSRSEIKVNYRLVALGTKINFI